MNKGLAALLGIITVAVIGVVGGYIYAEKAAGDMIDELIANAQQSDQIQSISYVSKDVNLIGDTITLRGLSVVNDVGAIAQLVELPQNMDMTGTTSTTIKTVRIYGIKDLMGGVQVIPRIAAVNIVTEAEMVQTMSNANLSVQNGSQTAEKQNADVTSTIKQKSEMQSFEIKDMSIAPFMGDQVDLTKLSLGSYRADNVTLDASIAIKDNSAQPLPVPVMEFRYKIASMSGEELSSSYIASARADDLSISGQSIVKDALPMEMSIGSIEVSDTKLVDFFPTQMTYQIKDMVIDPPAQVPPGMKVFMTMIGLERFDFDITVNFSWNEADKSLSLAPVQFGLKKVGSVELSIELFKLPPMRTIIAESERFNAMMPQDPETLRTMDPQAVQDIAAQRKAAMDALFAPVEIKSLGLGYKDAGALKLFMSMQAQQLSGGDVAPVAEAFAQQGAAIIAASHGPDKASEILPQLQAYLTDPGEIRVQLSADNPVNLEELNQAVEAAGPPALGIFDLSVTTPN